VIVILIVVITTITVIIVVIIIVAHINSTIFAFGLFAFVNVAANRARNSALQRNRVRKLSLIQTTARVDIQLIDARMQRREMQHERVARRLDRGQGRRGPQDGRRLDAGARRDDIQKHRLELLVTPLPHQGDARVGGVVGGLPLLVANPHDAMQSVQFERKLFDQSRLGVFSTTALRTSHR
jgi:hypothetical protein